MIREKLQTEVQTLKTERSKHANKTLVLGKELEQEKKIAAQLKKTTGFEMNNRQTNILAKGHDHQAEMQTLKEHHESEVAGLHGKAKTARGTSKRQTRKLKHALKDMENR